jgi:hypothetical protein
MNIIFDSCEKIAYFRASLLPAKHNNKFDIYRVYTIIHWYMQRWIQALFAHREPGLFVVTGSFGLYWAREHASTLAASVS